MCAGIYSKRRFFFHSHIFLYFISLWSFSSFVASQKLRKRILCVQFVSKYTCLCMKNIFGHPATISPRSFSYASNAMKQLYERRTLSYMISFIFPFFRLLPFPFLHSFLPFIYLFFTFCCCYCCVLRMRAAIICSSFIL